MNLIFSPWICNWLEKCRPPDHLPPLFSNQLQMQGEKIKFIAKQPVKFLGGTIQVPNNPSLMKDNNFAKLETLLDRVDRTPVTRKQKLKL